MEYPRTQVDFECMFPTDAYCISYLAERRWPDGFHCSSCNHGISRPMPGGLLRCDACRKQISVTSGTIFHRSHVPLHQWFRAIWWIVAQKNGVSAQGLKRILGMKSYESVWLMLHKIRSLTVLPGRTLLSGKVEVDETFVGGVHHGGKRGRGAEGKVCVGVGVEILPKGIGRARLGILKNCEGETLKAFVMERIAKHSHVTTDGWTGYNETEAWGYTHSIEEAQIIDGEEILPNVHRVAALLKRWLLGTHQKYCVKGHLQAYLDEFVFRFNRRNSRSRGLLFDTLIKQAVLAKPKMYKEIVSLS